MKALRVNTCFVFLQVTARSGGLANKHLIDVCAGDK